MYVSIYTYIYIYLKIDLAKVKRITNSFPWNRRFSLSKSYQIKKDKKRLFNLVASSFPGNPRRAARRWLLDTHVEPEIRLIQHNDVSTQRDDRKNRGNKHRETKSSCVWKKKVSLNATTSDGFMMFHVYFCLWNLILRPAHTINVQLLGLPWGFCHRSRASWRMCW